MSKREFREIARELWDTDALNVTNETLRTGALLRMADSMEKIASDSIAVRNSRDEWKRRAEKAEKELVASRKNVARLKARIAEVKA